MRDEKGRFIKGFKHTEESKKKIGELHRGMKFSEDAKLKMRLSHLGKKFSEATKLKMSLAKLGEKHHNWKGGRSKLGNGYIEFLQNNHPFANKRGHVLEHRLVMEKHIGRYLLPEEVVHHDGEKDDNRIEKLQLFENKKKHNKYHAEQRKLSKVS